MKREVHKLKHDTVRHLKGVHKQAKSYGDDAHKYVMGHLKDHLDKYVDKAVDMGSDAVAGAIKGKVPNVHGSHDAIDKVKGTVGNIVKYKVKEFIKKPRKTKSKA